MALKENITSLVLRRRLRQKMPSVAFDDLVEDCGKVNGSTIMNKNSKTKAKVKAPGRNGAPEIVVSVSQQDSAARRWKLFCSRQVTK